MDSGNNSASLQSSSTGGGVGGGGDEEYDSRASSDSFSKTFHAQNSSMFDPFANYFNLISRPQPPPPLPQPPSQNYSTTPNSLFNLDADWSIKTHNSMLLPSSDKSSTYFNNNSLSFGTSTAGISFTPSSSQHPCGGGGGGGNVSVVTTTGPVAAAAADQPITQPARNPKKRSRASRRAPTTVLTTDTTNFRAMVQEFTGIPAPPFTTSSYFPHRTRFDLFASAPNSSIRSVANAAAAAPNNNNPFNISQPPSFLRRPFPQKIQQPPPFISPPSASSSPSSSSLMLNCLPNINIGSGSGSSTTSNTSNSTINYQLPSGVANSVEQNSNLFGTIQQNSILTSVLQSSQKYPIGSKEHEQFQMPSNEVYGMNSGVQHGHLLSGLPNLISQEQATASSRNNSVNAANFHGDKVQETVTTRGGEGMMESWICSSD